MNIKKTLGILLLISGIVGFFYAANKKNQKQVFKDRTNTAKIKVFEIPLLAKQTYEFKFWGVDEEMPETFTQPHFEAKIKITNAKDQILFNQSLISITQIETGGKLVTHDGINYSHDPKTDEYIKVEVQIMDGDYMDIEIYKNLDAETDALPGLFIILGLIGLVIYFRGRNKK